MDRAALELIAVQMADFELMARIGVKIRNPMLTLDHGSATGFYWGINHHVPIPYTTQDIVERNLDAYAAGVLAREIIDSGGQDGV